MSDLLTPDSPGTRDYRVVHVTEYRYSDDVSVSYGRAHLLPRAIPGQVVINSDVQLDPGADELRSHIDYFGNVSTYYAIRQSHRTLSVTATSDVRVSRGTPDIARLDSLSWETLRDLHADDLDARPYVLASPLVCPTAEVRSYAAPTFTQGRPLGDALVDLTSRIHEDFEYVSGSTTVNSTVNEVIEARQGVCQDFAHLAVACLRSVGLAARYVSGYLETDPPPGQPKLQGADASHAWAAVRLPDGDWIDLDPTNNQVIDSRYVVAGWGRDYSDVPPLKGVILTHAEKSTMRVRVDVTRTA